MKSPLKNTKKSLDFQLLIVRDCTLTYFNINRTVGIECAVDHMHREHWRHRHCWDWEEEFRKQNTYKSHRKLQLIRAAERKSGKIWIFHFSFFLHSFTIDVWHRMKQIYEAELHHGFWIFYFTNLQFP